ncbi:cytochrome c oxidase assembly protein [Bermanella sp. R86510]|uniref:cytochrome c oxidase assembly protein n=1 Tax=unclassified Bermanella TaxID=2627862 RepID=UPI0037C7BE58
MKKLSAWKLSLIPVAMFGFGFALVPLYDVFCEVTGLNGKNFQVGQQEEFSTQEQTAKLQMLADPSSRDFWQFKPEHKVLDITSGKMLTTYYELKNPTDEVVTIQAIPSVAPGEWAQYLVKIECFCFNQQVIKPGETVKLPLQVTLSAKAPKNVNHLSLSYRIYRSSAEGA